MVLHDRAIVIQNATALKAENCPGQVGGKVPGIEVVKPTHILSLLHKLMHLETVLGRPTYTKKW